MSRGKKNTNEIGFIQLNTYTSPQIIEKSNTDYVEYGTDNDYFQYLIDRYTGSTTNQAIIKGTASKIYGKGLDALDSNRKPDQFAQMKSLFKPSDLRKIAFDRKLLGMGAIQVAYTNGKVSEVSHFPMETLRAGKMVNGKIKEWVYHPDWKKYRRSDDLKAFPVFGSTKGKKTEMYVVTSYTSGHYYYPPVDYAGALSYAYLEEVISEYLINDALNGFSGSKIINLNNGVPDKETQRRIKSEIKSKMSGAKGDKVIVSFNSNKDSGTTVENLPLDNAPEHYQYLSDECRNKLITGHNVTSPLLLGVRDGGSGLGSNADEIKNASLFYNNTVIKTYQDELIDAIEDILAVNGISLKLYFKTSQPLEFIDTEDMDEETKEEETGVKMSKQEIDFTDELIGKGVDSLEGYSLIDESDVGSVDDEEDLDAQVEEWNSEKEEELSLLQKITNLVSTGTARPNSKSAQDKNIENVQYKVRYKYVGKISEKSREFCKKMISSNKLYRKEDIIAMGSKAVNAGFGVEGADTYSIWEFKGGARCSHKWRRMTFKAEGKGLDVKNPNAETISTNKARKEGYRVSNEQRVSVEPRNMPNQGFKN